MAKFDFDTYSNVSNATTSNEDRNKVGYFNLKDDGDYAIVRFAYHTQKDFDIVTVHRVNMEGRKYPVSVSCLRGSNDDICKCPLCASTNEEMKKLFMKMYVKMISYEKDANGVVHATPVVWERPASFSKKLQSLIGAGYTDLSKYVFMITRVGAKGSTNTVYNITPTNPLVYPNDVYVEDFSAFNNFDLTRHSYYEKTFEDLQVCATIGILPGYKPKDAQGVVTQPSVQPTPSVAPTYTQPQVASQSQFVPPQPQVASVTTPNVNAQATPIAPQGTSTQSQSTSESGARPRRVFRYE